MKQLITYIGLDVHKETIAVALAEAGLRGEVREYGKIANTPTAVKTLAAKLARNGHELRFCYEAGPCGYGIQRQLTASEHDCVVVALSLIPRHGHHYYRPAWTLMHRRWLAGLRFEHAVHHIVLEDCIAAVEAAMARRDNLEAHIAAALPDWSLAAVVHALQALRGMALVAATTLVAEIGDITRFANPPQLMAYLGLVPSEHSSGGTRRQGGITKAGNGAARRMLIEAAWSYRFPARISREQLLRQEGLSKPIRDIAWKAQERLCRRYRKLARAGKPPTVVTAAIARELAGFVWAIAKQATH
jgi:transposase